MIFSTKCNTKHSTEEKGKHFYKFLKMPCYVASAIFVIDSIKMLLYKHLQSSRCTQARRVDCVRGQCIAYIDVVLRKYDSDSSLC